MKVKIERIRRITGYLTGTTDTWNDAKKQELEERVKHTNGKEIDFKKLHTSKQNKN